MRSKIEVLLPTSHGELSLFSNSSSLPYLDIIPILEEGEDYFQLKPIHIILNVKPFHSHFPGINIFPALTVVCVRLPHSSVMHNLRMPTSMYVDQTGSRSRNVMLWLDNFNQTKDLWIRKTTLLHESHLCGRWEICHLLSH